MKRVDGCFVLGDSTRCSGCRSCVIACFDVHRTETMGRTVGNINTSVDGRLYIAESEGKRMPIQCKHCENAPCLTACRVEAITRVNGAVVLNNDLCIGCKSCVTVCPFGAIEWKNTVGKATFIKCDFCVSRESKACIDACPNGALRIVNPKEENKEKRIQAVRAMLLP